MTSRRIFLRSAAAWLARPAGRLGVMCQLGASERSARPVLAAARQAGFERVQVNFAWDRVDAAFLRALPGWLKAEGLRCDALGAYVNCVQPAVVLMSTRAEDFARAIDYAAALRCGLLAAWTGSYTAALMKPDERNFQPAAADAIVRFLEPHLEALERGRLALALESYFTLAGPDARSLAALLDRLPACVGAVLDPPNLTPPARYNQRDSVLIEMFRLLRGRIALVHLKDFRLAPGGGAYELPGPLKGVMNYRLFADQLRAVPASVPIIAEHLAPAEFAAARRELNAVL